MGVASTIAGRQFDLTPAQVEEAVAHVMPEPLHGHYVLVQGRRYPPKQVLSLATGLDRADFTTHQARRTLKRLGFPVGRTSDGIALPEDRRDDRTAWPYGGRQADALRPFVGQWVVLRELDVLFAAAALEEVLAWERNHLDELDGAETFRVPVTPEGSEGWTTWSSTS